MNHTENLNDKLLCIQTSSNQPQSITKQIPHSINNCRLSENSSSETIFYEAKKYYETFLKDSEFSATLLTKQQQKKKQHEKNMWFNPPYTKRKNKCRKIFIKLIQK